jgi:hypothetical protein
LFLSETLQAVIDLGEAEADNMQLFTRTAIKEGLPEVSRARLQQTLYAEYPSLRPLCEKLRSEKAAHTPDTLTRIWGVDETEAVKLARQLVDVGFFEDRVVKGLQSFWVPFLYRDALELVQGTATD